MPLVEKPRPDSVPNITYKIRTDHDTMYVAVGYLQPKVPFEVFVVVGHSNPCEHAHNEALARILSTALRFGVPVEALIDQLIDIKCAPQPDPEGGFIKSPADGIAKVLQRFIDA